MRIKCENAGFCQIFASQFAIEILEAVMNFDLNDDPAIIYLIFVETTKFLQLPDLFIAPGVFFGASEKLKPFNI